MIANLQICEQSPVCYNRSSEQVCLKRNMVRVVAAHRHQKHLRCFNSLAERMQRCWELSMEHNLTYK
jgi:hypothetical protein